MHMETEENSRPYQPAGDNTENIEPSSLNAMLANMITTSNLSEKLMMTMLQKMMAKMNSLEQKVNGNPGNNNITNDTKENPK